MTLDVVRISLPLDKALFEGLTTLLSKCGEVDDATFSVTPTQKNFLPKLQLLADSSKEPTIEFICDKTVLSQVIANRTGKTKHSPHDYKSLSLIEVTKRLAAVGEIKTIDHFGVNFPWFYGLSPALKEFRTQLPGLSAYFRFPDGQDWDFILPATSKEIHSDNIDLNTIRRPKLELVSFEKASTPIVQIDCITTINYDLLKELFPEGIAEEELKNVWVYIATDMDIDLCLVLNEPTDADWSSYFKGHRYNGSNITG